jgi:tetratricopeptide (TPR) repeat protein
VPDAKFCVSCGESMSALPSDELTTVVNGGELQHSIVNDRFKIIKRLGSGGMGEVLLAEDIKLKRQVAIKSILKNNLSDTTSKVRFLREAQTASQLDHPNICTLYEIYEEKDKDYIVMQYIDGVTIDQIIGVKTLSFKKIVDIALQLCRGMREAHSIDVIHRDIKPGNIMIDKKGVVKILDFGLAKFTDDSAASKSGSIGANLTEKGFVMGTVAYISPEQAKGKKLDKRTDIFSFGVLLYEMIEGQNPFKREEQIETLYNVLNKEIEFEKDIPDPLKQIIKKAVEKEKENRYPDFDALIKDLENFRYTYLEERSGAAESVGGATEIIDYKEQEKLLKEIQKTSDKEELGDLVSRIKKFKASTERVYTTRKRIKRLLWGIPLLAVVVIAALYFFVLKKGDKTSFVPGPGDEKFYIYIHPFEVENKTSLHSLPEKIDYLLKESLSQFDEFKTLHKEAALAMIGGKQEKIDPGVLNSKFPINIKYELSGKISEDKDGNYTIDAALKRCDPKGKSNSRTITTTGKDPDSLIQNQVDTLTRQIYRNLYPEKATRLKKISGMIGTNWKKYSSLYDGILHYKRLEYVKVEKDLLSAKDLLISKYYLAGTYYFDGRRKEAMALIDEIKPYLNRLAPALTLKIKVIEARLKFKFSDEINYLKELERMFPFDKEVFYQLGEAYFHHAAPREAIPYYTRALELDRQYSSALNHQGYCYAYLGDHKTSIRLFQDYRDLDKTANSFDSLGDGYFYMGDLVNAEAMKQTAVRPENGSRISWPFQTLADIYIITARYQKAEETLVEFLKEKKTAKDLSDVLRKRAFIRYLDHDYEKALELIDKSIAEYDEDDINDNTPETHWIKGLILVALGKGEESKEQLQWLEGFTDKYSLDKNNFKAAYKYYIHLKALIAEKENLTDDSERDFMILMDMKDKLSYWTTNYNYQFFHTEYAKFLAHTGRLEDALVEIEKCLEFSDIDFPYIPALWEKAGILEKLNKEGVKAVYEKIDELYGESDEKNRLRDLLKTKLGR